MCYGGYDAKYMLRDAEERMKGVAFIADKSETPLQLHNAGWLVWLGAMFRRISRKDAAHG